MVKWFRVLTKTEDPEHLSSQRSPVIQGLILGPVEGVVIAQLAGAALQRASDLGLTPTGRRYAISPLLIDEVFQNFSCDAAAGLDAARERARWLRSRSTARKRALPWLSVRSGSACQDRDDPSLSDQRTDPETGEKKRLFPFQQAGVEWLERAGGRAILGDDMGLGKTAQALAWLDRSSARRALIVCPTSVLLNWQREARTWAPGWHVDVATTGAQGRRKATLPERGALVISWGLLARCRGDLIAAGFDTVIADEAHNAKNPTAQRTQALIDVALAADHVLLLTGTPVRNRPRELWTLLHLVDPVAWPVFQPYGERYCGPRDQRTPRGTVRRYDGATRLEELNALTRGYMLRREKSAVLTDLPPKRVETLHQPAPSKLSKGYRAAIQQIRDDVVEGTSQGLGMLVALRQDYGLAKVPAALEQIELSWRAGEPLVVFLYHREVLHALEVGLEKLGLRYDAIVGSTSAVSRQGICEAFQDGRLDLVIGSEACKEGITLTRAARVLFLEYWWTPMDLRQAEDRVHRYTQTRPVVVSYLHLKGGKQKPSLDDHIAELLGSKTQVIEQITSRESIQDRLLSHLRAR